MEFTDACVRRTSPPTHTRRGVSRIKRRKREARAREDCCATLPERKASHRAVRVPPPTRAEIPPGPRPVDPPAPPTPLRAPRGSRRARSSRPATRLPRHCSRTKPPAMASHRTAPMRSRNARSQDATPCPRVRSGSRPPAPRRKETPSRSTTTDGRHDPAVNWRSISARFQNPTRSRTLRNSLADPLASDQLPRIVSRTRSSSAGRDSRD